MEVAGDISFALDHLEKALVALEELRRLEHLPVDGTYPLGGRDE
mgnify:CR=1 FL=1